MKRSNLKYLVPNGITFLSLAVGLGAIFEAAEENLILASAMIFISYWLDMADGFSARKLNAQSDFGLQLDSLVDIICFGVAPAVVVFQRLRLEGGSLGWIVPLVMLYALAGAFRLARFNLLPPKTSGKSDSVGLAITQAGGTVAIGVLADMLSPGRILPTWAYVVLMLSLSGLMVSTIGFPPVTWFVRSRWIGFGILLGTSILVVLLSTFTTLFLVCIFYLVASVLRMSFNQLRRRALI